MGFKVVIVTSVIKIPCAVPAAGSSELAESHTSKNTATNPTTRIRLMGIGLRLARKISL
jgi:hypothetical protein